MFDSMIERGIGDKRLIIIIKQRKANKNLPFLYKSMKYFDMSSKTKYEKKVHNLIKFIYGKSKPKRPLLGLELEFKD